jgi:hypothetical protein
MNKIVSFVKVPLSYVLPSPVMDLLTFYNEFIFVVNSNKSLKLLIRNF